MQTLTLKQQNEAAKPLLVPAKTIARRLSCSPRYVHLLYGQGTIPGYRFGKACIRFDEAEVCRALGIRTEAAAGCGADQ